MECVNSCFEVTDTARKKRWGAVHHVPNTEYCKLTATEKGAKWVLGTW
ncbi:hypothetical protein [Prevotella intermedia]|nr:hypothetical protein [Prevotella intermedia]